MWTRAQSGNEVYQYRHNAVELIQPVEGDSVMDNFLGGQREGLHHIAFTVNDLDRKTAKLAEKGVPVMKERPLRMGNNKARVSGSPATVHFDTRKIGNFSLQLMQAKKRPDS